MGLTTLSSREFNQDASGAKRAAANGPVFITDRGKPAHVLLTIAEYHRLASTGPTILELLRDHAAAAVEFEPPRLGDNLFRPVDFS